MSAALYRREVERADLVEQLTALTFDESNNLFFTSDSCLSFAFLGQPLIGASEATVEKLNVILGFAFPPGSHLQITLWASPDIEWFASWALSLRDEHASQSPIAAEAVRSRVSFLEDYTRKASNPRRPSLLRDYQVIVTCKIPVERKGGLPTSSDIRLANELRVAVGQGLETMGMPVQPVTPPMYLRLMGTLLNWSPNSRWKTGALEYSQEQLIRDQILEFDTICDRDDGGLWLGDTRVKILSPRRYPEAMDLRSMIFLIGDPRTRSRGIRENFLITMNISFPDSTSTREKLEKEKMVVAYQNVGPIANFSPRIRIKKDGFDTLFEALDAGDRIVRVQHTFAVFGDSDDRAQEAATNMISYYREHGFHMTLDGGMSYSLFINALPMCADIDPKAINFFKRYRTFSSGQAAELAPLLGDWKGTGTPVLTFFSGSGQPMGVNLFDSNTNYNACIVAASGSGKSFLANEIIISYLSIGAKIWVIDVGRSYLKLCNALGGDFVEFSNDSTLCLNPFQLVKSYEDEGDILIGILVAMAAPNEKLSDFQYSRLRNVIKLLWDQHGPQLTIDVVADTLSKDPDVRVSDVGSQLYAFTSRGEYGRWFIGQNNVSFDKQLTVLELEELKGKPHLQQVVLLLLIYQIQQAAYLGDRKVPKLLLIDEAWDILTKGDIAKFIEGAYRRFRKYNCAAICITQSLLDLYNNPNAVPIADNSANLFLLEQKPETVNALKESKRLAISDGGFELLKTVHSVRGVYSEIFVNTGIGAGIACLVGTRYSQLLYSTYAPEVEAIAARRARGMSVNEAILDVIREEQVQSGKVVA